MGNVFKLVRNWLSNQPDEAKNVTPLHQSSFISTLQPVYSWDKKSEIETNQFRLNHLNEQYVFRKLLHQGQQFTIENCLRSLILITGFSDSIFVDDCKDCKIILGPVKGSIFLRNCSHCVIVAACGQLRTRDCTDITCYLLCATQPSIETSSLMKFQCISLEYPGLQSHLANAGLNPMTVNRWSEVFDFTPTSLTTNWRCLPIEDGLEDNLNEIELTYCTDHQIVFDQTVSAIPFTLSIVNTSVNDNSYGAVPITWETSENLRFISL